LPVATAPNAIVFGHSTLKTVDMMKAGMVMNIVCVFTIAIAINTYAIPLFGLNHFPDWARYKKVIIFITLVCLL
jgi:sodium-dependent dicarboxylate transporter 2/3/5